MPGGGSLSLAKLIDEFGAGLYSDLWFYYRIDLVDTIQGRGMSPRLLLPLAQRLPDTSLTVALASGGREHFGWGQDRHLLADLFDAVNQNTRATGNWGKKAPKIPEYPRPKSKPGDSGKKKKRTVADIFGMFGGKTGNRR